MSESRTFVGNITQKCLNTKIIFVSEKSSPKEELSKFSYQDLREIVNVFCDFAFKLSYVGYGVLQFFAILTGLSNVFHHSNVIMFLISLVLGFTPFIGTCFGIWGAHIGWGWDLFHSIFVFVIPYVIVNGPIQMIILFEAYKDIKRWKVEGKI